MKLALLFALLPLATPAAPTRTAVPASLPAYDAQVINPGLAGGMRAGTSTALILWGTDGTVFRSDDGRRWTHAQTPVAHDLAAAASDADGRVMVAVGAGGTIIRSQDGGRRWDLAPTQPCECDLSAVVYHAPRSTWIAAGSKGRILRSTDSGRSWQPIATQLTLTFEALFVDTRTGRVLIGGEDGVVGVSTDAGASWQLTWIAMPEPLTPVTGFHRHGDLLLATSALGRFLQSRDDAQGWDLLQSQTRAFFTDVAHDPSHDTLVMIGHDGTVLRSTDRGVSWQAGVLQPDSVPKYLSAVRYDPHSRSLLAVGHGGTIARSVDGGANWTRASRDIAADIEGMVATRDGDLVMFGNGGLIATSARKTRPYGNDRHWTTVRENLDLYLRDVAAAPDGDAFVATGQLGDLVRSADGVNWRRLAMTYPEATTPPDLRALIRTKHGLIAAGPPGAVLRSDASGERWTVAQWTSLEAGHAFPALLFDHRRDALVALEAHGAMRVSHDAGGQWRQIDAGLEGEFWQGDTLEDTGVMLVAGRAGAAARSTDAGARWSAIDAGTDQDLFGVFADDATATFFLTGANGTLRRSTDGGLTWSSVVSGTTQPLRRMLRDPRSGALICFGGGGALLRSGDAGGTWQPANSGVDVELRKGLFDPRTGSLLIAGRTGVVLRSTDGGRRWDRLPTHTHRNLTSIAVNDAGELVAVGERIVRLTPREQP